MPPADAGTPVTTDTTVQPNLPVSPGEGTPWKPPPAQIQAFLDQLEQRGKQEMWRRMAALVPSNIFDEFIARFPNPDDAATQSSAPAGATGATGSTGATGTTGTTGATGTSP